MFIFIRRKTVDYSLAVAAIYFDDPDGNSIKLITPIRLDTEEDFEMMTILADRKGSYQE